MPSDDEIIPAVSYFDARYPTRGVVKPFNEMAEAEFLEWREDYFLGLLQSPFGRDETGEEIAPYGMSIHGVPRLRPEDE